MNILAYTKPHIFFGAIILLLSLLGFGCSTTNSNPRPPNTNTSSTDATQCTMEAKLCPDGSYVGRTGLNCEFEICPSEDKTSDWETAEDTDEGLSFKYPVTLGTSYIMSEDWPPRISRSDTMNSCADIIQVINNKTFCISQVKEGALGSVYATYTYTLNDAIQKEAISLEFTLRYVQCTNYEATQAIECENEQSNFNIDEVVSYMMASVIKI